MKPDARQKRNTDPAYFAGLVAATEWPQHIVAARLGISPRALSNYVGGYREVPYCVQFAMERLADNP